jgi:hypothetical protein
MRKRKEVLCWEPSTSIINPSIDIHTLALHPTIPLSIFDILKFNLFYACINLGMSAGL